MKARKAAKVAKRPKPIEAGAKIIGWTEGAGAGREAGRSLEHLVKEMAELRAKILDLETEASEQREREEAQRESDKKYRFLVDHSREIILILDKSGRIIFANRYTVTSYGYGEDELVGMPITAFLEPESAREAMAALGRDYSGRPHVEYEVKALTKSGEHRYLRIAGGSTPVHENGRQIGIMVTASDVTEQKRADEILRESEKKFRNLAEQSPNMIFLNLRGRIVYVNLKCCAVMGYKKAEFYLPKFNFLSLIAPESLEAVKERFQEHMKGRPTAPSEHTLLTKTGRRFEAIINTQLIDYGEEKAILGTVTDISHHKRSEEARRDSEETFRTIFDNALDAYYLIGPDGSLVDANRTAETMMGYEIGELVGQNVLRMGLISPEQVPKAAANLALNLQGGSTGPELYRMIKKDGGEVWAELSSHPIKLLGRTLVLGIARDITERRLAEETLTKSEMKYRALFESANDAVFLMDLKDDTRMVNPKAAEMLGYSIPELLGMPFKQLIGATDYQATQSRITDLMGDGALSLQERVFLKKDGTEIPVEINISLHRDENGRPLYIQRIVRDISARKKYVSELLQGSKKLRLALEGVIKAVAATVEQRDPYTAGHQKRVAELARAIAAEMSLSADQIEAVYMAGVIHDVGKIAIPVEILSKPGALGAAEFSLIKLHVKASYEILKDIDFPWPITQIIYQHHERLDGSGYPQGLVGEAIRTEARILAVADVVEAMASHRPYRPARGLDSAFLEISKADCYDQTVVAACRRLFTEKGYRL